MFGCYSVEAFSQENNDLKKKVDSLENNNRSLLGQLQKLQALVGKVSRHGGATTQTGTVLMVGTPLTPPKVGLSIRGETGGDFSQSHFKFHNQQNKAHVIF